MNRKMEFLDLLQVKPRKQFLLRTFADNEDESEEDFYMRIFRDTPGTVTASATKNVARCVITESRINTITPEEPTLGTGDPPPGSPPSPPTYPPLTIPDEFHG